MTVDDRAKLRKVLAVGLFCLLAVVIAFLTLLSPSALPSGPIFSVDKLYHAIAFGSLVVPSALFWREVLTRVAVAALAYGAAIEVIQPMFGRASELADLAANAVGISLVYALGVILKQRDVEKTG